VLKLSPNFIKDIFFFKILNIAALFNSLQKVSNRLHTKELNETFLYLLSTVFQSGLELLVVLS